MKEINICPEFLFFFSLSYLLLCRTGNQLIRCSKHLAAMFLTKGGCFHRKRSHEVTFSHQTQLLNNMMSSHEWFSIASASCYCAQKFYVFSRAHESAPAGWLAAVRVQAPPISMQLPFPVLIFTRF